MKRVVALLAATILTAWFPVAVHAAQTTLRITLQLPLKSHIGQNLLKFKNDVEKKSDGEIEVQIFDSAQLFKDKDVPQAVGSGAIEMGVASLTRFVGEIPAVDIFYLPFVFNSESLIRKATEKGSPIRTAIDDEILKTGSRVLWWQAFGGAILLSKGSPIKTPDDLKGKKVRVFGKTLGEFIETLGGVPTLISGSEQYLAYQRGTVDVGMTGVSAVTSRSLWDVVDTITVTNHANIEFVVLINEKFWRKIPEAHQSIILEAANDADKALRNKVFHIEAEAFSVAKDKGMKVYLPNATEINAWREGAQPVIDGYKAAAGDLGESLLQHAESMR